MPMDITMAGLGDVNSLAKLAVLLWPEQAETLAQEIALLMEENKAAFFLAWECELPIGCAHCALRHDYVEGTNSCPVGYLEGIYVLEEYRREGVAAGLLSACENWAREKGCAEFASDCAL